MCLAAQGPGTLGGALPRGVAVWIWAPRANPETRLRTWFTWQVIPGSMCVVTVFPGVPQPLAN